MRAVVCDRHGHPEDLQVREIAAPALGEGEILVDVAAAGVNFPDLLMVQDRYQHKPGLPFVPGMEFAGTVAKVADGVTRFAPGDRVFGRCRHGAFAEQLAVPAHGRVAPMPATMSFADAASIPVTFGTSYHALRSRGALQPGETLLVLGAAGGVGLSAVALGTRLGARVIACASSDDKLETCIRHGAQAVINYQSESLRERVKALTEGRGVDVVCDPVGGPYAEPALRSMAWGGRYLVIGFAAGDIPRLPFNLPLLKGCAIVGVSTGGAATHDPDGARRDLEELAALCADGTIRPHLSAIMPMDAAGTALRQLAAREVVGKIVLAVRPEAGALL